jgi:hypothetical protein
VEFVRVVKWLVREEEWWRNRLLEVVMVERESGKKLVRWEGKLREKIIRNVDDFFVEFFVKMINCLP